MTLPRKVTWTPLNLLYVIMKAVCSLLGDFNVSYHGILSNVSLRLRWLTAVVFGCSGFAVTAAPHHTCPGQLQRFTFKYFLSCAVRKRNGPPQNHPQRSARVHPDLHPWCRSQVINYPSIFLFFSFFEKYNSVSFTVTLLFVPCIAAHWMMSSCLTSPESWRILARSRALRKTLTWRFLQRCWRLTYPALLKLKGKESHFFFLL